MRILWIGLVFGLAGCDMGHLGNPVMWPGMAVGNSAQNASYNTRRAKVEKYVARYQSEIISDIRANGGAALSTGMDLARVPPQERPAFLRILKEDLAKFAPNTAKAREQLVIWLMVHGH